MSTKNEVQFPSTTKYDSALEQIPHYKQYPAMMPYVGINYDSPRHKRMLLIAESNYLSNEATIHQDADTWYQSRQAAMTEEEVKWIHCRNLWSDDNHYFYQKLEPCLASLGVDDEGRALSHVAFMNAFQRPSRQGDSIKSYCTETDIQKSGDVIRQVIASLEAELVVFMSKYAWEVIGSRLEVTGSELRFVCHPAAYFYWNTPGYYHGREKFVNILREDFLKELAEAVA